MSLGYIDENGNHYELSGFNVDGYASGADSVSVTADGVKTYGQLLNELYALVDTNRVTKDSCVILTWSTTAYKFILERVSADAIVVIKSRTTDGNTYIQTYNISASGSTFISTTISSSGATSSDNSSSVVPSGQGIKFTLYYDSITKVIESCDADDVSYDNTTSGLTSTDVQDAINEVAVKTVTETITSNSFHWIVFPQGRKVLNAVITGSYNTFFLYYEASNNRYITKWFVDYNPSTFSPTEVTASTSYSITYQYI